jgi:hypothetical protein
MPLKRNTKRKTNIANSSDSSSAGDDDFIVSPHARRSIRRTNKTPRSSGVGSSSQHSEIEEPSDAIQKIFHPLKPLDHRHPRRPTDVTRKENHSMIQRNDDPYVWAPDLLDHRFWNNFQADWYITVIKNSWKPITPHIYVDWASMLEKRNPVFNSGCQSPGAWNL